MKQTLPSVDAIKRRLSGLNHAELQTLAAAADVPFPTLMKIRQGVTKDPRLNTALRVWATLPRLAQEATA